MTTLDRINRLIPSLVELDPGIVSITCYRHHGPVPSSISILCLTDQDAVRVAAQFGVHPRWISNAKSRWMAADAWIDDLVVTIYGMPHESSEPEADARAVAEAG